MDTIIQAWLNGPSSFRQGLGCRGRQDLWSLIHHRKRRLACRLDQFRVVFGTGLDREHVRDTQRLPAAGREDD